ncbi:hypothetical protein A946_00545 [Methylacidiphilum kamchatkense Kam1]|uniref:Uncharacterized protein n=1 Tax=Methylacidiphilum kamchatkense Kam1 TaxID=1202785 RepID=A0A0C1RMI7_9BACT|nr:hypothetical protein [Methylacidiphilum kamchatkense]KIE59252.1 hypothetical protein A946_00545 [Methylacidiphilum kamchatkense Kam1]QDQ42788.1 hypothetical protein kam1_1572 [Methylacidiphilum kamchatkense Kam1]
MKRALAVLVGEIHTTNHYKSLINALPQLDQQGFVVTLELARDFNPLIQHFMRKASQIYEKANEHKIDAQEAEKRVDQLEAKMIYQMQKRYPAVLALPFDVNVKKCSIKKEKGQWIMVDKSTGEKFPTPLVSHYTDVIKEVVKHNVQNHGNLQVYAVDISTKEMKEQVKSKNLYLQIGLPKTCQQPIEEYLKKARKSAFLGKSPKESLRKKLFETLQKEGIIPYNYQDLFDELDKVANLQRKEKFEVQCDLENIEIGKYVPAPTPAFLDYRDRRMAGNLEYKEDHRYGPCNIKRVAETRHFYYPGSRVIHWGGAFHLGEYKWKNNLGERQTNLSKEVKQAGFPYIVTADGYTNELRNYPTNYVFESQRGLQKAITHGIKIQTTSPGHFPLPLSEHVQQKGKDPRAPKK